MEVNEAMEKLGYTGKWQALMFIMIIFMLMPTIVWNNFTFVMNGYIPKHHCKIPDNSSIQQWIPKDKDGNSESCSMFVNSSVSNKTVYCTDGWEYDDQDLGTTIVNEWDLVCDKAYYPGVSQAIFYIGQTASFYLLGLADIYGRKPISLIFLFLSSTTGILNSFAESFTVFILENFFLGLFSVVDGIYGVYLAEMTSKINMEFTVLNSWAHWGINGFFLVIIWYFLKHWRYLRFVTNLFGLLMLPILIWLLPETVYWLHTNNRIKEAEEVLISAGKLNNVQFTTPILIAAQNIEKASDKKINFEEKTLIAKLKETCQILFCKNRKVSEKSETQYSIKELYRNPHLLRHMSYGLCLFFNILTIQSLTFLSPALSFHKYLSTFISFSIEIPCGFLAWIISKRYIIRNTMILCSFSSVLSFSVCVLFLIIADVNITNYTTLIFCTLAKFFTSMSMAVGRAYSCTLFPTNLRNRAYAICLSFARFGVLVSAFSSYMLTVFPIGTYFVFVVSSLMNALILLILPDTSGLALPEKIEDIDNIYKKDENSEITKLLAEMKNITDDHSFKADD